MPELEPRRKAPIGGGVDSGWPDELLPSGELLAGFFNRGRATSQHSGDCPYRKMLSNHAARLQDAPIIRIEVLQLDLQHLP